MPSELRVLLRVVFLQTFFFPQRRNWKMYTLTWFEICNRYKFVGFELTTTLFLGLDLRAVSWVMSGLRLFASWRGWCYSRPWSIFCLNAGRPTCMSACILWIACWIVTRSASVCFFEDFVSSWWIHVMMCVCNSSSDDSKVPFSFSPWVWSI